MVRSSGAGPASLAVGVVAAILAAGCSAGPAYPDAFVATGYLLPAGMHLADGNSTFAYTFLHGVSAGGKAPLPTNPGFMRDEFVHEQAQHDPRGLPQPKRIYMAILESDAEPGHGVISAALEYASAAEAQRASGPEAGMHGACAVSGGVRTAVVSGAYVATVTAASEHGSPSAATVAAAKLVTDSIAEGTGGTQVC